MRFRSRLLLAFWAAALVPLLVLALGLRREVGRRLHAQYEARAASAVAALEGELATQAHELAGRLDALAAAAAADNRFRRAASGAPSERAYLLDYAGRAMALAGLSVLQIRDPDGRILSSGHFRNEYDRLDPDLPRALANAPNGFALARVPSPEGSRLVLARLDSLRLGDRALTLVGGVPAEPRLLSRWADDRELAVEIVEPRPERARADELEEATEPGGPWRTTELPLPYVDATRAAGLETARFVVRQSLLPLEELRRSADLWLGLAFLLTAVLGVALAAGFAGRLGRPLADLARKTSLVDLDRLDFDFGSDRPDEVGALSRLLGAMTERLRAGAARLRETERRAAIGDLARQVNHDVKNGIIPLRNVIRHLDEVARERPGELREVFEERRRTLDSSLAYLEALAANYARLSPTLESRPCDLNEIARQVARELGGDRVELRLAPDLTPARGDPVLFRRIVENLATNAIDSLGPDGGRVTISTERAGNAQEALVRLIVMDTGRGMTREQVARAFDDFYTTKPDGTGLGLSIVRRLVRDSSGAIRVESEPGYGSRFILEWPAADREGSGGSKR